MQANFGFWKGRISRYGAFLVFLSCFASVLKAQSPVTVNFNMQTGDMDRVNSNAGSGGIYNSGTTGIGMWMAGDNIGQGNVVWDTFRVGSASNTSARELQIGDEFTITVNTRGVYYGTVGVSLNDGNDFSNDNFTNRVDCQ